MAHFENHHFVAEVTLKYFYIHIYFIWNTNSSIWIINGVTTCTTLINTIRKWIKEFHQSLY